LGSWIENTVPLPGLLHTEISPPARFTKLQDTLSPNPELPMPFGGKERVEDFPLDLLSHPDARVGDLEDNLPGGGTASKNDGASLGHCLNGIEDQIGEDLTQV